MHVSQKNNSIRGLKIKKMLLQLRKQSLLNDQTCCYQVGSIRQVRMMINNLSICNTSTIGNDSASLMNDQSSVEKGASK